MENMDMNRNHDADIRARILGAFKEHVLEYGKEPASIFKFARNINIREEEFYTFYTSFTGVKGGIWNQIFDQTIQMMESQQVYRTYTAKERLLSFYFNLIEVLKQYRSYLLVLYQEPQTMRNAMPPELRGFRDQFKEFAKSIIMQGKETGQIADRKYVSDKYDDALWLETLFILGFWLRDTSTSFEKTDAAIEKSVNLAFDLIGRSAVDSFVDFAKFLYQSK